jgi:dihydroflavonol-4-reductase
MSGETVLVTGGSGFIGAHCILQLLGAGYQVRTTVRSADREGDVRRMLETGGAGPAYDLSFYVAELLSDEGWAKAVDGCDFVLHVASPFPVNVPRNEDDLILPAREGALRVLKASRAAGVRRVVLTSSFAAVGYGRGPIGRPFTEQDWTVLDPSVSAYAKSKTLAEHAAWDFIASEGGGLELAVVNPVVVFGPVLGPDYSTSVQIVQRLLNGGMPALPRLSLGVVDVRDVADLHLRAMTHPDANGERFLAVAGDFVSMLQVALVLKEKMGDLARRAPTRMLPSWTVRLASLVVSPLRQAVPDLDQDKQASNNKARSLLGWEPRSSEDAIVATAQSLAELGLLRGAARKRAA